MSCLYLAEVIWANKELEDMKTTMSLQKYLKMLMILQRELNTAWQLETINSIAGGEMNMEI